MVLGINLLYELALVFLLFQDLDSARSMMKYLDPNLGLPLPEKSYAENCDLTVANVWVRPASIRPAVPSLERVSALTCGRRTRSTSFAWRTRSGGLARPSSSVITGFAGSVLSRAPMPFFIRTGGMTRLPLTDSQRRI